MPCAGGHAAAFPATFEHDEADCFRAGARTAARRRSTSRTTWARRRRSHELADAVGGVCERAPAQHGLTVCVEFMPEGSITDLAATAARIVETDRHAERGRDARRVALLPHRRPAADVAALPAGTVNGLPAERRAPRSSAASGRGRASATGSSPATASSPSPRSSPSCSAIAPTWRSGRGVRHAASGAEMAAARRPPPSTASSPPHPRVCDGNPSNATEFQTTRRGQGCGGWGRSRSRSRGASRRVTRPGGAARRSSAAP